MRSDRTLRTWYKKINSKFFDNFLPNDTCVRWANEEDTDEDERCEEKYNGWAYLEEDPKPQFVIVLSSALKKSTCSKLHTLVHEMVHVATGCKDDHGPAFSDWHQRLTDKGIFKKHALLKNYTIF